LIPDAVDNYVRVHFNQVELWATLSNTCLPLYPVPSVDTDCHEPIHR
jgi:hypothetical protein